MKDSFFINEFKNKTILCIGDIMLDKYVYGSISRISPEAPIQVFDYQKSTQMLGGCGNVVANVSSIGCKAKFLGIVGDDQNGHQIRKLLKNLNCHSHVISIKNLKTITKTRIIAGHNHILRIDQEQPFKMNNSIIPKIQKLLERAIKNVDIVIISDYAKGLLTDVTVPLILSICKKYNKISLIDPKGSNYSKYNGAYLIKPNLKEFKEVTRLDFNSNSQELHKYLIKGAKIIFKQYDINNLIITMSENGMAFISSTSPNNVIHIPTQAKEVYDVSGAGDTSIAAFACALSVNNSIVSSMNFANIAAGIAVSKIGTVAVTKEEIEYELLQKKLIENKNLQTRKIITLNQAKIISKQLKQDGKIVGFTNGCFDLLHLGHLNSFIETKNNCDVLFVGLNSDKSIKKLKGNNRPIQDEKTRSHILAALEYVDYIIIFDDKNALSLINSIKPNVIAKEGYKIADWPEAQEVLKYGGKAITLKRLENFSTSNTINKLKEIFNNAK